MGRRLRIFEPGAYYHLTSRGNDGRAIVHDDLDRLDFLRWLSRIVSTERWRVLVYCLMTNHYHLLLRAGETGFASGMQLLNCGHAHRMNRKRGRTGHLFRNHYSWRPVESDEHLLEAIRYILLNPVPRGPLRGTGGLALEQLPGHRRPRAPTRLPGAVRPTGHLRNHSGHSTRRVPRHVQMSRMTLAVINPATEETIAELDEAGIEETDAAVARAHAAFPAWRAVAPTDRARLLRRLATLVEEHAEELARIESQNVGKPISGARAEVAMVAQVFHFYAGAVDKHHGETIPVAGGIDMTFREPLGVVGLIVPWNFPLNISSWKLGPALACGNTVVLKPAELTPLSALRLAELILEAGIPEGVVNVVVGPGRVVGQRLVEHPDVAKIGFTGSTEVGRGVMRGAAGTIKRVTLELGGKSANVVFADADLERAAAAAPYAVFDNAGQDCCARSRILVERSAYDRFAELLIEATRNVRVGDPEDDTTEMGPLISAQQRDTVASFVEGDTLFRGDTPNGRGFWFPCTLVEASNDDRVAREEVFGPVAALISFADEEEAIRIANDTPYGLSGSIWTENGGRALRVARALETGVLSINSNSSVRPTTPFGGFKQSGFGRELGLHALEGYSEVKNVFMSTE